MWRDRDFGFGVGRRLLEDVDKEFAGAEEMLNRMFRTARETSPSTIINGPYYYGYQITVGPDRKPHVREFGNARPTARGLVEQSGVREPLVDTKFEEKDNTLTITAEMPGVTKQDISVKISEDHVTIHAEKGEKKYHTDIPVDVELDDKSAKAIYSNGILELNIKLKAPTKPKETEIQVE